MENVTQTFDVKKAIQAQNDYVKQSGGFHFAPGTGNCYRCHQQIFEQKDWGSYKTGISVENAGAGLITGCPHCNYSYCD